MSNRKRRGRGESSVYQRADGQWAGSVSMGYDENGKRKRKVVYAATKKEVVEEIDRLKTQARAGTLPDAGSLKIGQLLDRWLETSKAKIETRTYEERERLVKNHVRPRIGGMKLSQINSLHIEGLYADLRRDGASAWTVRHVADLLSIVLNHATRLKLIAFNPASAIPKPKVPKKEMLFLNEEQTKALLTQARSSNQFTLLAVALGTGCRQGELLALRWEDIDLKKATLTVRKSLSQTNAGFVVKEPKTKSSRRTVSLPDATVLALTEYKSTMMKAGLLSAPVFCTRTGNHLCKKNVLRAFRTIVKKVKSIPEGLRFHDLRHTVASLLLSKGCSIKAVSQRLGHSNPAMTLRVYAHSMPNDDIQLAASLNEMIA